MNNYKQLILVKPKTRIIAKIFGVILILVGSIIFLTGVIAIITIIGIFYTLGAGLIAFALIFIGLSNIFGSVNTSCPYCGKKLRILSLVCHSVRCYKCFNLVLIKWKDEK